MMRQFSEMMGQVPDGFGQAEGLDARFGQSIAQRPAGPGATPADGSAGPIARRCARSDAPDDGALRPAARAKARAKAKAKTRSVISRPASAIPRAAISDGNNGTMTDAFQRIPGLGEGQIMRSQEILDELIRRLGERARPEGERDYLERLLRRF